MYELYIYDKAYSIEKRFIFSRKLTLSEISQVLRSVFYNDARYTNKDLQGDVQIDKLNCLLSPMVYLDFDKIELNDYLLIGEE